MIRRCCEVSFPLVVFFFGCFGIIRDDFPHFFQPKFISMDHVFTMIPSLKGSTIDQHHPMTLVSSIIFWVSSSVALEMEVTGRGCRV